MDHPQVKETTCTHCNEVFPSKGKYQYHFRRVHQEEVKIHHSNHKEIVVLRSESEKFLCICNKNYHSGQSLRRHQKHCQQWKDYETDHNIDSNSEISIQGNILYFFCILFNL